MKNLQRFRPAIIVLGMAVTLFIGHQSALTSLDAAQVARPVQVKTVARVAGAHSKPAASAAASPSKSAPSAAASAKPSTPSTPKPAATTPTTTTPMASATTTTTPKASTPAGNPASVATPAATAPASDIAPTSVCPNQSDTTQAKTVLACMTSYARAQHGLVSVTANTKLMSAGDSKAQDIKDCSFSHTACGRAFDYWFTLNGYQSGCRAENIAMGQSTPYDVFTAWMNSTGHRANILGATYKDIGIGAVSSSQGTIWVMELGGC